MGASRAEGRLADQVSLVAWVRADYQRAPVVGQRLARGVLEPADENLAHVSDRELPEVGDEGLAGPVPLADQLGPVRAGVEEDRLQLVLDERSLLLYHQHVAFARGELTDALGFEWPGHCDLVDREPELAGPSLVDAESQERLTHLVIGLSGGHYAEWGGVRAEHDPVEPVDPGKNSPGPGEAEVVERALGIDLRAVADLPLGPPGGRSGTVMTGRSSPTVTDAAVSTVSVTQGNPTQHPQYRDMAMPYRPRSR